ncbi:MAG: hypothetical protein AAF492_03905, partial [Verrucomicrobiota bacterium]
AIKPKERTVILGFYDRVRERLAGASDFLDLSGVLDDNGRSDFYDLGHTAPYTGADIGRAMAVHLRSPPHDF